MENVVGVLLDHLEALANLANLDQLDQEDWQALQADQDMRVETAALVHLVHRANPEDPAKMDLREKKEETQVLVAKVTQVHLANLESRVPVAHLPKKEPLVDQDHWEIQDHRVHLDQEGDQEKRDNQEVGVHLELLARTHNIVPVQDVVAKRNPRSPRKPKPNLAKRFCGAISAYLSSCHIFLTSNHLQLVLISYLLKIIQNSNARIF